VTRDEDGMLAFTAQTREAGSRLSCQIELTPELDGLRVTLPASQY
jgi:2Fe-2S ferredoxin